MAWPLDTFKTKQAANDLGRKILREKFPKRQCWKLRVWENLGWHFSFHNGLISVYYHHYKRSEKPTFSCLIGENGGGEIWNVTSGEADRLDPLAAVRLQIKTLRNFIARYQGLLDRPEIAQLNEKE